MGEERKMETDLKKELKIFGEICKVNDALILDKTTNSLLPIGAIIYEDYSMEMIGMVFTNTKEKLIVKKFLFDKILSKKIRGYIIMLDAKMTKMDMDGKNGVVRDVVVRGLYTPKKTIKKFCFYKDHKILHEENKKFEEEFNFNSKKISSSPLSSIDEWDLFNSPHFEDSEESKKLMGKYADFKKQNPKDFKDIC